jgi:hypothetical protein
LGEGDAAFRWAAGGIKNASGRAGGRSLARAAIAEFVMVAF